MVKILRIFEKVIQSKDNCQDKDLDSDLDSDSEIIVIEKDESSGKVFKYIIKESRLCPSC